VTGFWEGESKTHLAIEQPCPRFVGTHITTYEM